MTLLNRVYVAFVFVISLGLILDSFAFLVRVPESDAQSPQIQNFTVNINESESSTIFVPVDNSGSPLNWTNLHLSFLSPLNGIKISTDPFLFEDGFVQANSENYSLRIVISVDSNVSLGSYTIPFTLIARSSTSVPSMSTSVTFDVIIIVLKSPPMPFPLIFFYLAVIFISAVTMIGIVLIWGREWNISEVKK